MHFPRGQFRCDHQLPQRDVGFLERFAEALPAGDTLYCHSFATFFSDDLEFFFVELVVQIVVGMDVVVAAADALLRCLGDFDDVRHSRQKVTRRLWLARFFGHVARVVDGDGIVELLPVEFVGML